MSIEIKEKNKRAVSVKGEIYVSKEEMANCVGGSEKLINRKKRLLALDLGEFIESSLEMFEMEDEIKSLKYSTRLICINEKDYKQMLGLVINHLGDAKVEDSVINNIKKLLTEIVG